MASIRNRLAALAITGVIGATAGTNIPNSYEEPPARAGEIVSARTETSYTVDLGNGRRMVQTHAEPIHHRIGGQWKRPDLRLKGRPWLTGIYSKYESEIIAGAWKAQIDEAQPGNYRIESGSDWLAFDLLTDAEADLETDAGGIKEYVTLWPDRPDTLRWTVTGSTVPAWDGAVLSVGTIRTRPLVAWDATGKPVGLTAEYFAGMLTVAVDTTGAAWPVTVDPSARIVATDTDALSGRMYISAADWSSARNGTTASSIDATELWAGITAAGGTYRAWRGLLRFDTSETYNGATIDSVRFKAVVQAKSGFPNWNLRLCATTDSLDAAHFNATMYNEIAGWAASGAYGVSYLSDDAPVPSTKSIGDTLSFGFNATGKGKINDTGTTQFWLMASSDISNATPDSTRLLRLEDDSPYLTVYYSYTLYNTVIRQEIPLAAFKTHRATDPSYSIARQSVDPTTQTADTLGQKTGYTVYRMSFIVPGLPEMNHIAACSLYVTGTADGSTTDRNINLHSGLWGIGNTDASRYYYTNIDTTRTLGTLNSSAWNASGTNRIPLALPGYDWLIAAKSDTAFGNLVWQGDKDNLTPTGNEFVSVNPSGAKIVLYWALNDSIPAAVAVVAISPDSVLVTWRDRCLDETGYQVVNAYTGAAVSGALAANTQSVRIGGLSKNTVYPLKVKVLGGTFADSLSAADSTYTLATTPGKPTITFPTDALLKFILDTESNPDYTEFAVEDSLSGLYVYAIPGPDSFGVAPFWGTYATFGGTNGDSVAVLPGKKYNLRVKARSGQ